MNTMMSVEEAQRLNALAMSSTNDTHETVERGVGALMKQLMSVAPVSKLRMARIHAAFALAQSVKALLSQMALVLGGTATGTDVKLSQEVVDEVLAESDRRVEQYIEARRGDRTDELFEEAEVMAAVVLREQQATAANKLLDQQSEAFGQVIDDGLHVVAVTETGVIARKEPLTGGEMLLS